MRLWYHWDSIGSVRKEFPEKADVVLVDGVLPRLPIYVGVHPPRPPHVNGGVWGARGRPPRTLPDTPRGLSVPASCTLKRIVNCAFDTLSVHREFFVEATRIC